MDMAELCSETPNSRHPDRGDRRKYWKCFWAGVRVDPQGRKCVHMGISKVAAEAYLQTHFNKGILASIQESRKFLILR